MGKKPRLLLLRVATRPGFPCLQKSLSAKVFFARAVALFNYAKAVNARKAIHDESAGSKRLLRQQKLNQRLLGMQAIFSLIPNHTVFSIHYPSTDFFASMRRQAMHHQRIAGRVGQQL